LNVRNVVIDGMATKKATIAPPVKVDIIMNQRVREKHVISLVGLVIYVVASFILTSCKPSIALTVEARNGMMANHSLR